jgi:hypothetical protein
MSQPSTIAERLLAHAKLCRQIASECWNEEMAQKLEQLAQDCLRAAAQADPSVRPQDALDGDTASA